METKVATNTTLKVTPKLEVVMGEVCQAVKALDQALDQINFLEQHRTADHANFHSIDASLPDVTLGELMTWVNSFACEEGPEIVRQAAGTALVKARARQLAGILKPITRRVCEIAEAPVYRNHQPFLLTALAHPKVCWAFEDLHKKMDVLADR